MADQELRDELHARLATLGLTVAAADIDAVLPSYTGLLNGTRRLASLDLGEREPAMIFPPHRPAPDASSHAGDA